MLRCHYTDGQMGGLEGGNPLAGGLGGKSSKNKPAERSVGRQPPNGCSGEREPPNIKQKVWGTAAPK